MKGYFQFHRDSRAVPFQVPHACRSPSSHPVQSGCEPAAAPRCARAPAGRLGCTRRARQLVSVHGALCSTPEVATGRLRSSLLAAAADRPTAVGYKRREVRAPPVSCQPSPWSGVSRSALPPPPCLSGGLQRGSPVSAAARHCSSSSGWRPSWPQSCGPRASISATSSTPTAARTSSSVCVRTWPVCAVRLRPSRRPQPSQRPHRPSPARSPLCPGQPRRRRSCRPTGRGATV